METTRVKLVTIVAEGLLGERLLADLTALGVSGYTCAEVSGVGAHGARVTEIEGPSVRIETLVAAELAQRIMELLAERYFNRYSVVAYAVDAEVVRGWKYRSGPTRSS
jgi:nitrogen regulatory protein P-II 2